MSSNRIGTGTGRPLQNHQVTVITDQFDFAVARRARHIAGARRGAKCILALTEIGVRTNFVRPKSRKAMGNLIASVAADVKLSVILLTVKQALAVITVV
mgnify:CR=1 FL=1